MLTLLLPAALARQVFGDGNFSIVTTVENDSSGSETDDGSTPPRQRSSGKVYSIELFNPEPVSEPESIFFVEREEHFAIAIGKLKAYLSNRLYHMREQESRCGVSFVGSVKLKADKVCGPVEGNGPSIPPSTPSQSQKRANQVIVLSSDTDEAQETRSAPRQPKRQRQMPARYRRASTASPSTVSAKSTRTIQSRGPRIIGRVRKPLTIKFPDPRRCGQGDPVKSSPGSKKAEGFPGNVNTIQQRAPSLQQAAPLQMTLPIRARARYASIEPENP